MKQWICQGMLGALLVVSASADAGVIDVDIWGDGRYQGFTLDTPGYALEWMDFGVQGEVMSSVNDVEAALADGGLYDGWREATVEEVVYLWLTLFGDIPAAYGDTDGPRGYFYRSGVAESGWGYLENAALGAALDVMGYVQTDYGSGYYGVRRELIGYIANGSGDYDQVVLTVPEYTSEDIMPVWLEVMQVGFIGTYAVIDPDYDFLNAALGAYSVMLVRDKVTDVPAPGSALLWCLAVVLLGVVALSDRRRLVRWRGERSWMTTGARLSFG